VQHAQKAFCQKLIMIVGVTAQWRTWECQCYKWEIQANFDF